MSSLARKVLNLVAGNHEAAWTKRGSISVSCWISERIFRRFRSVPTWRWLIWIDSDDERTLIIIVSIETKRQSHRLMDLIMADEIYDARLWMKIECSLRMEDREDYLRATARYHQGCRRPLMAKDLIFTCHSMDGGVCSTPNFLDDESLLTERISCGSRGRRNVPT